MIARYTYKGLTWIDLESPTEEEIAHIREEFSLPELVGDEILTTSLRSKVDLYDDFIYLILHFPTIDNGVRGITGEQEIDFIVGKDYLITVRYGLIDPIHQFAKAFETRGLSESYEPKLYSGIVFTEMMKQFYKRSITELEDIADTIKDIENRIFEGQEELMVREISRTNRKLLDFKQAIRFHRDILESFETASRRFFGESYSYHASLIISEYNKVDNLLESHRDIVSELQRTNDSLLSSRSNEIMKTFTIMTFVMVPLTVITGIFGMNTVSDLIFIQNLKDFYFIIGAMILAAIVMFLFFRVRKWL